MKICNVQRVIYGHYECIFRGKFWNFQPTQYADDVYVTVWNVEMYVYVLMKNWKAEFKF